MNSIPQRASPDLIREIQITMDSAGLQWGNSRAVWAISTFNAELANGGGNAGFQLPEKNILFRKIHYIIYLSQFLTFFMLKSVSRFHGHYPFLLVPFPSWGPSGGHCDLSGIRIPRNNSSYI